MVVLGAVAPPLAAQDRIERLFYYVDRETSYQSLLAHIDEITILSPSAYSVNEQGIVWGDVDPRVVALAKEHRVGVMPLIVNPGFNQEMLSALLASDTARARAVRSMVELCRRHGYLGIQFDFENINTADRDRYTRFYREAADALHRESFQISMAVVHRPDVLPGPTRYHAWLFENWRGGYDLRAIAEAGDFISVMTYSQHTRRTPPGPEAGIPWVREVVEFFLEHMPAEKLSLGIPLGGQHWYVSQEDKITPEMARSYSRGVSHAWALGLLERHGAEPLWSDVHQVPYGFYSRGGTFEWLFFENARSFQAKLGLLDEYGLRGFSAWVLGPEDRAIWEVLSTRRR
jgi:spore germination protein YaaH